MPKRPVNIEQGFAGMGNASADPDSLANPMNIAASGMVDFDYDDGEFPEEADENILKDANGNRLRIKVKKKMPDADGKVRNTTAGIVYLTPAVCEICGFRGALNYTILNSVDRERVRDLLKKHKIRAHPVGSELIVAEKPVVPKPTKKPEEIFAEDGSILR